MASHSSATSSAAVLGQVMNQTAIMVALHGRAQPGKAGREPGCEAVRARVGEHEDQALRASGGLSGGGRPSQEAQSIPKPPLNPDPHDEKDQQAKDNGDGQEAPAEGTREGAHRCDAAARLRSACGRPAARRQGQPLGSVHGAAPGKGGRAVPGLASQRTRSPAPPWWEARSPPGAC